MNPSYRVLIAEDETTYAMTVARFLQERGPEIKVCPTGKAAFKALPASEWDVLLLDLKLPDADGMDVLRDLRALQPDLRGVITTSYASQQPLFEKLGIPFQGCLVKPFSLGDLEAQVRAAL